MCQTILIYIQWLLLPQEKNYKLIRQVNSKLLGYITLAQVSLVSCSSQVGRSGWIVDCVASLYHDGTGVGSSLWTTISVIKTTFKSVL